MFFSIPDCGTRVRASCHNRLGSACPPAQSYRDILQMMGLKIKAQGGHFSSCLCFVDRVGKKLFGRLIACPFMKNCQLPKQGQVTNNLPSNSSPCGTPYQYEQRSRQATLVFGSWHFWPYSSKLNNNRSKTIDRGASLSIDEKDVLASSMCNGAPR